MSEFSIACDQNDEGVFMFNNVKRANVQTKRISHTFCVALLYTKKKRKEKPSIRWTTSVRVSMSIIQPTDDAMSSIALCILLVYLRWTLVHCWLQALNSRPCTLVVNRTLMRAVWMADWFSCQLCLQSPAIRLGCVIRRYQNNNWKLINPCIVHRR